MLAILTVMVSSGAFKIIIDLVFLFTESVLVEQKGFLTNFFKADTAKFGSRSGEIFCNNFITNSQCFKELATLVASKC